MTKLKLTILIKLIGLTYTLLLWLQGRRYSIVEAELSKLETGL